VIAKLQANGETLEIRSPIAGRLRTLSAVTGKAVAVGDEIAVISPDNEQLWEALRALYLIGKMEELAAIAPYERELADIPDHIRRQAVETERAIRERAK
jgi:pyruvate/2-oxoglutarate dehydrogenase complex dihydrolipoamide acyltransferase (E2) component